MGPCRTGKTTAPLEVLKMPYVGCNILSSSLAMDKITTKRVLESAGIAQVPYVAVVDGEDLEQKIQEIEEKLSYPVFTKPSNMGSSVGISKSDNQEEATSLTTSPGRLLLTSALPRSPTSISRAVTPCSTSTRLSYLNYASKCRDSFSCYWWFRTISL